CLLHLVVDHRDDRVVGDAALTRAVVVQNVTEPKPALLHELPRSRSFSGGIAPVDELGTSGARRAGVKGGGKPESTRKIVNPKSRIQRSGRHPFPAFLERGPDGVGIGRLWRPLGVDGL